MVYMIGRSEYTVSEQPIVAGAGSVALSATTSRRSRRTAAVQTSMQTSVQTSVQTSRARLLLAEGRTPGDCSADCEGLPGSGVWGDVSNDGVFTSLDLYYAQQVLVKLRSYAACNPFQKAQLDPTQDGKFDPRDVNFLLQALAGKLRFVANISVTPSMVWGASHRPSPSASP